MIAPTYMPIVVNMLYCVNNISSLKWEDVWFNINVNKK